MVWARLGDIFTFTRILMAPILAGLLAAGHLEASAVVLVAAWLTDSVDGYAARVAAGPTRLEAWDLRADAWLAVGQGLGLGLGGYVNWWIIGPISLLVFIGSVVLSNPSPVMVGIGGLSVFTMWVFWDQESWWWLPVGCLGLLLVFRWKRFWGTIMPALWHAVLGLFGGESQDRRLVIEDWAKQPD